MGKSNQTEQDRAYIAARTEAGRYKPGDTDRRKGTCYQCHKPYYDRVGELRDAAKGLRTLQCHYCEEMAERYAPVAHRLSDKIPEVETVE